MSSTQEIVYRNRTVTITVAANGHGKYVGSFTVPGTEPLIQGSAADESSEEEARTTAERKAKELIDQRGL